MLRLRFGLAAVAAGEAAVVVVDAGATAADIAAEAAVPRQWLSALERHGVIYVSAASGREWKSKGVPNSVMIVKPFILTQLVTTIREVVWKDSSALLVRGRAHASTCAGFVRPPA